MNLPLHHILLPLLFIAALFYAPDLYAAAELRLSGAIYNAITSKELPGPTVEILNQDSTVIASFVADHEMAFMDGNVYTVRKTSQYYIDIPKVKGIYYVKVSLEGYDTVYHRLDLTNLGARQSSYDVEKIYLRPVQKVMELDEVVVKTSKVKFYHKGDTLVYNADAFMLPEGSMLDALVKQLPGVEVREGGAIYVNGRYVESLLLNGKDFFKGNKQVMLENLGAYMVKDIQVYEKGGHLSEMMGKRVEDDTQYVMDVKLKKDYMAGNLINAKLTGGTEDRFLVKIFGLHYTNNSRIGLYVNANNLNDTDKPTDGEGWQLYNGDTPGGLTDTYRGGLDYNVDNPQHTWQLNGNVDVSYTKNTNNTDTYATNFLTGGNTYDYSFLRPVNRNLGVTTLHDWWLKKKSWQFHLRPTFTYNRSKTRTDNTSASFSKEMEGITPDFIANLTKDLTVDRLDGLINRNIVKDRSRAHGMEGEFFTEFFRQIGQANDVASIWLDFKWTDRRQNRDNDQSLLFGGTPFTATLLNQHYKEVPNRDFTFNVGAKYYFNLPKGTTGVFYNFTRKNERKNSDLYLLEARREDGTIPEVFEGMEPVLDAANSYASRQTTNSNQIRPFINLDFKFDSGSTLYLQASPEFSFYNRHLHYRREALDVSPKRNDFTLRIMGTNLVFLSPARDHQAILRYDRTPRLASLVDMVDFIDTSDPLNIQEGNPGLKNAYSNDLGLTYNFMKSGKWNHYLSTSYQWTENDLVRGYRYDSQTGVRTFKTYNVAGNNVFNATYGTSGQLPGALRKFGVSSTTGYAHSQYANMIGEDRDPVKQNVVDSRVRQYLGLRFRHKERLTVGAGGSLTYHHTSSETEIFDSFNAFEFSYGINGYLKLPMGIGISTDLYMLSRRGYSQSVMNDNRLLWNAAIDYTLMKGALIFRLNGNDMLGQTRSITYDINARGRTETRVTTLPRYFSLSVEYRFDFKPKREKQAAQE